MDATKQPLLIPPQFSTYAEKHGIFQIYERMLKRLVITQPDDPLQAMIDLLQEPEDVPKIIVIGPPGSGKRTISRAVADKLNCVYICQDQFSGNIERDFTEAIVSKIASQDCIEKGWLLEACPKTRNQATDFQAAGVFPQHVVQLDAPDAVLIERVMGKRVDSMTGDVYHITFDPPTKADIKKRLVTDPNSDESIMVTRLQEYHRNIDGITRCYTSERLQSKLISADQPKEDVLSQVHTFLSTKARSQAPHTPRVLLLGPTGSGKSVQARMIAEKYQLINVCFKNLVDQTLENDSDLGQAMRPYSDRNVSIPDELLLKCLVERLGQIDAVRRGWVLHGFPNSRLQVDAMVDVGYEPNRVIILDAPNDVSVERLSLRNIDPVTGERYHLLYNPPRTADVKARLLTHPNDEEAAVMARCTMYAGEIEDILEYYTEAQRVNADQDVTTVFESIETIIVNPLPKIIDTST